MVELDGNYFGVASKVGVRGEDLPSARDGHSTDQEIDSRSSNASAAAFIVPVRCLFVIPGGQSFIREGSQSIAQLSNCADSRMPESSS